MKLEINLTLDGNQYCALIGPNLQEGIAGFGKTPIDALLDFVAEFEKSNPRIAEKIKPNEP